MNERDWIMMSKRMQEVRLFSRTIIHRTTKDIKISSQQLDLLSQLILNEKITPLNLAKLMGVSKTIISRIIDSLYKDELIIKINDETDHRSYMVSITDKGRNVLEEIYKSYLGPIYKLRTKMGEKDFNKLMSLIEIANSKMNVEVL